MGQRTMNKPPTKAKPSAEAEEAPDELRARLLELAQDSFAAFYREPTEENLQLAQLLLAKNFRRQVAEWVTGELDALKLARAALRGCGMTKDDAKSLLRSVSDSAA